MRKTGRLRVTKEMLDRNWQMLQEIGMGLTFTEVSKQHGISATRVHKIVTTYISELGSENLQEGYDFKKTKEDENLILLLNQQGVRVKSIAAVVGRHRGFVSATIARYFDQYMDGDLELPQEVIDKGRELMMNNKRLSYRKDDERETYLKGEKSELN